MRDQVIAFDVTSISSYWHETDFVERGYNGDRTRLAQINVSNVYGQPLSIARCHRPSRGSVPDVETPAKLLKQLRECTAERTIFVCYKGFYGRLNAETLAAAGMRFVIPVPIANKAASCLRVDANGSADRRTAFASASTLHIVS